MPSENDRCERCTGGQRSASRGAGGNGQYRPARRLRPDKVKACINAVIHAFSPPLGAGARR